MSGESSAKYIKPLDVTHVMSVWGNQKGRKTLLGLWWTVKTFKTKMHKIDIPQIESHIASLLLLLSTNDMQPVISKKKWAQFPRN